MRGKRLVQGLPGQTRGSVSPPAFGNTTRQRSTWDGPSRQPCCPLGVSGDSPVPYSGSRAQAPALGQCCGFCGCFNNPAIPDQT